MRGRYILLIVIIALAVVLLSQQSTYAKFSSGNTNEHNSFSAIAKFPTPTPRCRGSTITISGNADRSTNNVTTTSECNSTTSQSNNSDVATNVAITANTGGNSGENVTTGNASASSNVQILNSTNSNSN